MGKQRRENEDSLNSGEKLVRDLAARAIEKQKTGQKPTREEAAALKRVRKNQEEKLRWQYYETIPQKHWTEMSGRQPKVLKEQEAATGIPCGGSLISLPAVVRKWHDLLATHKYDKEIDEFAGASQDVKDEHVRLKNVLLNMDIDERKKELIPRAEMHKALGEFAKFIRDLGESLYQEFGAEAQRSVEHALEDFERSTTAFFHSPTALNNGPSPSTVADNR
jgi:hypothetical protein